MADVSFIVADPVKDRDALMTLNIEYLDWVFDQAEQTFGVSIREQVGMPVADYVSLILPKICAEVPPRGVFYLLRAGDELAGMGGLRFLRPGVCEIKRLYVRPAFRGRKFGETAFARLLADADRFGYERVFLDVGPFSETARRLYAAHGFAERTPYEGVEVPEPFHDRWHFLERAVRQTPGG